MVGEPLGHILIERSGRRLDRVLYSLRVSFLCEHRSLLAHIPDGRLAATRRARRLRTLLRVVRLYD